MSATAGNGQEGVLSEVCPGQQITVVGRGFLPYSSATVIIYSSPVLLGTAVTDAHGAFTEKVTVPTDLEAGAHNLVASGVDLAGATHLIRMPVTVAPATSGGSGSNGSSGTAASVVRRVARCPTPAFSWPTWPSGPG